MRSKPNASKPTHTDPAPNHSDAGGPVSGIRSSCVPVRLSFSSTGTSREMTHTAPPPDATAHGRKLPSLIVFTVAPDEDTLTSVRESRHASQTPLLAGASAAC